MRVVKTIAQRGKEWNLNGHFGRSNSKSDSNKLLDSMSLSLLCALLVNGGFDCRRPFKALHAVSSYILAMQNFDTNSLESELVNALLRSGVDENALLARLLNEKRLYDVYCGCDEEEPETFILAIDVSIGVADVRRVIYRFSTDKLIDNLETLLLVVSSRVTTFSNNNLVPLNRNVQRSINGIIVEEPTRPLDRCYTVPIQRKYGEEFGCLIFLQPLLMQGVCTLGVTHATVGTTVRALLSSNYEIVIVDGNDDIMIIARR